MFKKKTALLMVLSLTVGTFFAQGVEGGCWNIGTQTLMTSIQPCGILFCGGPILGGAVDLCGPAGPAGDIVVGCP
jgi:hypothetical protein